MSRSLLDVPKPVSPGMLRAWMTEYGLSQTDLARILGTKQSTVGRWLSGQTNPPGCLQHALGLLSIEPNVIAIAIDQFARLDFEDGSMNPKAIRFGLFEDFTEIPAGEQDETDWSGAAFPRARRHLRSLPAPAMPEDE